MFYFQFTLPPRMQTFRAPKQISINFHYLLFSKLPPYELSEELLSLLVSSFRTANSGHNIF